MHVTQRGRPFCKGQTHSRNSTVAEKITYLLATLKSGMHDTVHCMFVILCMVKTDRGRKRSGAVAQTM